MRSILKGILMLYLLCHNCFAEVRLDTVIGSGGPPDFLVTNSDADYLSYVRYMTVARASQSGTAWDNGDINGIKALEDPVRRQIYDKMQATGATEPFKFRNVAHAVAVINARKEALNMLNNFINDNRYWYWDEKSPVSSEAKSWSVCPFPYAALFYQKSGTPSAAIADLCLRPDDPKHIRTHGDCLGAIITCIWWGVNRGMGVKSNLDFDENLGNSRFNNAYNHSLDMRNASPINDPGIDGAINTSVLIPGDWVYMRNANYEKVTGYTPLASFLRSKGWLHADQQYFCSGENLFYLRSDNVGTTTVDIYGGLGSGGYYNCTEKTIRQSLIAAYNKDLADVIKNASKIPGYGANGYPNVGKIEEITEGSELEKNIVLQNIRRITIHRADFR